MACALDVIVTTARTGVVSIVVTKQSTFHTKQWELTMTTPTQALASTETLIEAQQGLDEFKRSAVGRIRCIHILTLNRTILLCLVVLTSEITSDHSSSHYHDREPIVIPVDLRLINVIAIVIVAVSFPINVDH